MVSYVTESGSDELDGWEVTDHHAVPARSDSQVVAAIGRLTKQGDVTFYALGKGNMPEVQDGTLRYSRSGSGELSSEISGKNGAEASLTKFDLAMHLSGATVSAYDLDMEVAQGGSPTYTVTQSDKPLEVVGGAFTLDAEGDEIKLLGKVCVDCSMTATGVFGTDSSQYHVAVAYELNGGSSGGPTIKGAAILDGVHTPTPDQPESGLYPAVGDGHRLSYVTASGDVENFTGQGQALFDTQTGALLAYVPASGIRLDSTDPSASPKLEWPEFDGTKGDLTIGLMSLDASEAARLPYVVGAGWIPSSPTNLSYSLGTHLSDVGAQMTKFELELELNGTNSMFDLDMELTHGGANYALDLPGKRPLWMSGNIFRLHSSDLSQHLKKDNNDDCVGCTFDASGMLGNQGANAGLVYSLEDGAKNIHGAVILNNTNP